MPTAPRIAIAGGGPGGLTLARVLHVHGIAATVYERDPAPGARAQGGTLDLHPDTGQYALRAAGLDDGFRALARPEGEDLVLLDPSGTVLLRETAPADSPAARPEIDRADLRDLLLNSLPSGTVAWGTALRAAVPDGGGFRLAFADGTTAACDVLIGADGAYSRVRPLLTDAVPAPLGVTAVEADLPGADRAHPELAHMVGRGNYWMLGVGRSVSAQRHGDGRIRVHALLTTADADTVPLDDPAATRAALTELFAGWAPQARALLDACAGPFTARPLAALPVGLRWDPRPGVTLLGDAAHLMPPVGQGANTAMRDAADLAAHLAAHLAANGAASGAAAGTAGARAAIAAYEPEMFARSAEAAALSARVQELLTHGGAAGMLRFFTGGG